MIRKLREHGPEYLMEAAGLGVVVLAISLLLTLLEYPGSPIHKALSDPMLRRVLKGLGIALIIMAVVYSPWGKRSGAHMNPAMTLAFARLGKVHAGDTVFYVAAQVLGGLAAVGLV